MLALRQPEQAEPCLRQAIAVDPGYAQAHNNLGNALQAQGRFDAALGSYGRALQLKPDYHEIYDHVGLILQSQGRLAEAVAWFSEAIRRMPEFAQGRMNRALAWLQMGDFARGWTEYEWRFLCPEHAEPPLAKPVWEGAPLDGRPILLRRAGAGRYDPVHSVRTAGQGSRRPGHRELPRLAHPNRGHLSRR